MATAQIVKWGNSLAIRIPKPVAEEAGVTEGDAIELKAHQGEIQVRLRERVPSLQELVSQITPENRHGETMVDREIGKEIVEW